MSEPTASAGGWTKFGKFGIDVGHKKVAQCHDTGSRDLLFEAHTAALAAEREVTQSWFNKSLKLEAQLAAEQKMKWELAEQLEGAREIIAKHVRIQDSIAEDETEEDWQTARAFLAKISSDNQPKKDTQCT